MVSCSDADFVEDNAIANSKGTRANLEDAYVRIGMYANIEGYNLRVENMRVENCLSVGSLPKFGNNIVNAEVLPNKAENAIFDNANGEYNAVPACEEGSWTVVHFDVVMTSASDFDTVVHIEDVKYYISPEDATWTEGGHYNYIIRLDEDFLDLSSIDFSVDVEDFQDINADTDC